jgi:hypothetical protein
MCNSQTGVHFGSLLSVMENLVLQALQFYKVGICSKFPDGASVSHN